MQSEHEALFEPINLGKLRLGNRIVLAPTYVGMGDLKGNVTDQSLCYYFARASGGVGLVIVEIAGVTGRFAFNPGFGLGAGSEKHLPGLRDLAQVIHWGGAKALIQLLPGQGAQALQSYENRPLVGPSDVPAPLPQGELPEILKDLLDKKPEQPRPLTREEIQGLKVP